MKILAYVRTKLTKPFQGKHFHEEGEPVVLTSKIITKNFGTFFLIPPDPVSLSLNDAQNFIDKSIKLKERISKSKDITIFPKKYKPGEIEAMGLKNTEEILKIDPGAEIIRNFDDEKMYSFLQSGVDAMISLVMAVESFSNIMIPKDFKDTLTKNGKKIENDKEKIVRYYPTIIKLEIIGKIYNKSDFKSKPQWKSFLEVKKLRNDFIHFKEANIKISTIWNPLVIGLIDSDLQKFYDDIVELIKYFRPEYFD